MKKFYAVKGEENSIFTSWEECKNFLEGKKGYKHKAFSTEEEARAYLLGKDLYEEALSGELKRGYAVCYTDGSYEETLNEYSFGALAFSPSGERTEFCGKDAREDFLPSRNVAGEVLGALAAVKWAVVNGFYNLKIYHDYEGLSKWATGEWAAKSPVAAYYVSEFSKYSGLVSVAFVKEKGHSNNAYNEEVDALAKAALFEGKDAPVKGRFLKISGDAYREICEYVHIQAPKATWKDLSDGTDFVFGTERLSVRVRDGATLVSGDGEKLFAVAVCAATLRDEKSFGKIIGRAYGFSPEKEIADGYAASEELIGRFGNEECGKFLFFALAELSAAVKSELAEKGVKYDKILDLFRLSDGKYEFKEEKYGTKLLTEKAFDAFYRYRTVYFKNETDLAAAKKALKEIKAAGNKGKRK